MKRFYIESNLNTLIKMIEDNFDGEIEYKNNLIKTINSFVRDRIPYDFELEFWHLADHKYFKKAFDFYELKDRIEHKLLEERYCDYFLEPVDIDGYSSENSGLDDIVYDSFLTYVSEIIYSSDFPIAMRIFSFVVKHVFILSSMFSHDRDYKISAFAFILEPLELLKDASVAEESIEN